jgi:IS4 transposase
MRDVLLPTLKAVDILVMDNLSTHKDRQALDLLHQAGVTVRFLPAYLSNYNPIEMMWSKVKSLLRKIEARDNESLLVSSVTRLAKPHKKMPLIGLANAATTLFKFSNSLEISAFTVATLYKLRWRIELFLRWIAVCTYIMLAILHKRLKLPNTLHRTL